MDVQIDLCGAEAYAALVAGLGVRHVCPGCGSSSHGRPEIDGGYLSIAHAGGLHVLARADRPIGVDAEPDRIVGGIDVVALHRAERAVLSRLNHDGHARATLEVWVAKEAALKLTGSGLQVAPESFVVRHAGGWYVEPGVIAQERVYLSRVPAEGYVIMLAGYRPAARLVVRRADAASNLE